MQMSTVFVFRYSDDIPATPTGGMDINTALQEVLKMALTHGSLAHGLHEAAKALDKYVKYA
jgi:small subunit ribosomal protein S12e